MTDITDATDAMNVTTKDDGSVDVVVDLRRLVVLLKERGELETAPWDTELVGVRQRMTEAIHKMLGYKPMTIRWFGGQFKGDTLGDFESAE